MGKYKKLARILIFNLLSVVAIFGAIEKSEKRAIKKAVAPAYPSCAIEKPTQGMVLIQITINKEGNIESAERIDQDGNKISGNLNDRYQCLVDASIRAAKKWQFAENHQSSKDKLMLRFNFKMIDKISAEEDTSITFSSNYEIEIKTLTPNITTTVN